MSGVISMAGSTVLSGTGLALTTSQGGQDGSLFTNAGMSTTGFTTTFTFAQTGSGTLADGFCFVLQNNSPTLNQGSAGGGGGLGYANSTGNGGMANSIAVKFDLYDNSGEGNDSTGLFIDGDSPSVPSGSNASEATVSMSGSKIKLTSGDPMTCTLSYNGVTLSETITDTKISQSFSTSYTINIPATIGSATAYAGFTGATGGAVSTQTINTWTYTSTTSAPYAPSNTAIAAPSSSELDLSWSEPYSTVNSYTILRQNSSGAFVSIGSTTATTFPNTGLSSTTTYTYEITATNSVGSATSAPFSGTTPLRPTVISNLTSTGITTSTATLNWTDGAGVTGVTITRTLVPDNTVVITNLPAATATFSDSGLLTGREYDYGVSGTTSTGATQPTFIAVQTVPGQPQNVDGNVNGTTVALTWDPLGYAVSSYNIYRSTTPGGEGTTPIATGVTTNSYRDPGLTTGQIYYYTVTAVDSGGQGIQSGEVSALAAVATPDLVISEFLASNVTSITDKAGAHSDWIEIHNAGSGDADLSKYYLTDDPANPELWQFPVQTLSAGGYLTVWADGLNVAVAGQELHTNFSLSKSGEYLALIGKNDIPQFQYSPTYPDQSTDISYGLSDSDNPTSALQFFGTPTPGAANAPTAAEATFSVAGETFSGSVSVSLSDTAPNAQIRYTLDNSTPTSTSPLYTGPITVSKTEMVRAKVFATGYTSSPVDSQTYIDIGSSETSFNNNLGIIIIDTFGQALNDTTDILAGATFIPATSGTANILGTTPNYTGRIGLHIRGSSSEGFAKQQYGVTLWDENNNNTDASIMGFASNDKYILNDPYSEKSLLQNPLSYQWANEMGEYATKTQFVEVFLNTTGASSIGTSQYWGIYILEQRIKIGKASVNINQMSTTDTTAPAVTGGYIWEKDRVDASDTTFTTTITGQQYLMVAPNASDINSAQLAYISGYVNQFESALYGTNFESPTLGYAAYINVKSFVDMWLAEEMVKNIDGFRLSAYYYKDENGLICAGPMWDNNLALGNSNYSVNGGSDPTYLGSDPEGWDSTQLSDSEYPYYNRLFQDPTFKQDVTDEWSTLRATVFTNANLVANITTLVNQLSNNTTNYPVGANGATPTQPATNAVVRNFERWTVLGTYGWPNGWYDPAGRWIDEVQMTQDWVLARVAWMDSQLLPAPILTPGGLESATTTVTMTPYTNIAADTTLLAAGAAIKSTVPTGTISNWNGTTYNDSSWTTGTSGVGYDNNSSGFTPYIGLNNSAAMSSHNATVYTRSYFTVTNPSAITTLILEMRYSGGFVAYLNGVQVAYVNVSNSNDFASTSYNSTSTASQTNSAAITFQSFNISVFENALVAGTNVLAIQGLNSSSTNGSFLLEPVLVSRVTTPVGSVPVYYTTDGTDPRTSTGAISASAVLYNGAFNLSSNTTIEARTDINGTWSGLAKSTYQFGKPTLAITELMYDPAKPPLTAADQQNDDYEFIEFINYGTQSLNLNGITFTNGITYTFGNVTLAPGQVGVLVHNTAAFQSRYGTTGITILGDYNSTGQSFSNSGEEVTLVDAIGDKLADFTYSPSWSAGAHQGGYSLEVTNPFGAPNLNSSSSWTTSTVTNGTPGTIELNLTGSTYIEMDAANQFVDVWNSATPAGAFAEEVPLSSINAITYTGTTAGTGLTVDFTNGDPLIAGGLTFNGGTGSLASLNIVGTAGNDSLNVGGSTLSFNSSSTGVVPVSYINASSISFNGSTGSDVLIQSAQPGASLSFISPTSLDTLNVSSGTYSLAVPTTGAGIVPVTFGSVYIAPGASMKLGTAAAHSDRTLLVTTNLTLGGSLNHWTGLLDLGGNDLEVVNGHPNGTANQLMMGASGAGVGIISSTAQSNSSNLTTLGVLLNQNVNGIQLYGYSTSLGLFDGANPGPDEVLVKYTYYGDANLDGKVDGSDYSLIDAAYTNPATGWYNGDFNRDGVVDGTDYTLIDNAFNSEGASLAAVVATPANKIASAARIKVKTFANVFNLRTTITIPQSDSQSVEAQLEKEDRLDTLSFAQ